MKSGIMMKRMPTLFVGHGSPMMALEHTETTSTFQAIGKNIINNYGKPKAILAISAHYLIILVTSYISQKRLSQKGELS